ncbi:protein phosphatase 2C domain containing protein [Plasmodium gonderi]|uniref:Protein phosphatase 2C domain containing protein n=1 Tax=Plasmodium gonderi TaxID=77519 RepID=A0A1Y1JM49_PLAGO|nr:protein phosphatase 2C domain containing protein [Plasmodium gonderi]GAW83300.1 protein phosphatase 2C domain containing protein [Plasmodium gonderi]
MGNCMSIISYSKFKLKKKKLEDSDVHSNPDYESATDSNIRDKDEKNRKGKDLKHNPNLNNSNCDKKSFNVIHEHDTNSIYSSNPGNFDQNEKDEQKQPVSNEDIGYLRREESDHHMIIQKNKKKNKNSNNVIGNDEMNQNEGNQNEVNQNEVNPNEVNPNEVNPNEVNRNQVNQSEVDRTKVTKKTKKEKSESKSNINGKVKRSTSKDKNTKDIIPNSTHNDRDNSKSNETHDYKGDVFSNKNSSFNSESVNSKDLQKRNKRENLLNIKYSNMILNDIRDVDIIVVFLFSLFLYFNANNIVDMLDRNKKDRYSLRNSLNINHDIIKFPTFPKEIIDSFLKNDFTLLKKYIKNKCNKLKKKYKSTYLKKVTISNEKGEKVEAGEQNQIGKTNQKDEKNTKKKSFKYELKEKKEKCTFSKIIESVDRNEWIHRDITEIPCDQNLPDLKITFIVMGAYCFYQKNMKPFQDKNTFFYKSPSYACDAEISVACKKGRKLDFPNQDDFTIIQTNEWILIMVFDGHGPSGHDISNFVHVVLPLLFSYNIERIFENPVRTMKTLFYMINCYLVNYSYCINNNINPININFIDYNLSGTTCTIILYNFLTKKIYSAHTGDSRAVMGKQNEKTNTFRAYNITEDHKPSLKLERERIVAFGGEVKKLQGDVSYRVFVKNEMYPGLAMSRAIGDITSSFIGVTCEPTIKIFDKSDEDKFIIVATDGIWEFISSEECVQMVSRKRKKKVHVAMEEIIKESWRRWERIDTVDDMTLVILYF